MTERIIPYMGGIIRRLNGQLIIGGGADDHIHLATTVPPTVAISDFIGTVKANCTRWIHQTFTGMDLFAWQDGYAVFSVSSSVLPQVKQYICTQREHHRKITFQEELIILLEKHGVEYDKRYVQV